MKRYFILFCAIMLLFGATAYSQTTSNALKIIPNGNVGIGTDTPTEKLEVAGNINSTGNISATGNLTTGGRVFDSTGAVMPVGTVIAFAGTQDKIPAGWLICDGTVLDRTDARYTELFNVIGTSWGAPNATQFNVPDMRGMFLRGVASGDATTDPDKTTRTAIKAGGNSGNAVGSIQADAFQKHQHYLPFLDDMNNRGTYNQYIPDYNLDGSKTNGYIADGGGAPRPASETRPVNVYVYYIIKY